MATELPYNSIQEQTSWYRDRVEPFSQSLLSPVDGAWLSDAPSPFDLDHETTARLIETNRGVSPCILGELEWRRIYDHVPMGYTQLFILEKRAVIAGGDLLRLWPSKHESVKDFTQDKYRAIIADEDPEATHLSLGVSNPLWAAVKAGVRISHRMSGAPVLLTKILSEVSWH